MRARDKNGQFIKEDPRIRHALNILGITARRYGFEEPDPQLQAVAARVALKILERKAS